MNIKYVKLKFMRVQEQMARNVRFPLLINILCRGVSHGAFLGYRDLGFILFNSFQLNCIIS